MRPACALLLLGLTGCASVLGIEDPDTENVVSPSISGTYVLTIDVRTNGSFVDTLLLLADVEVVDADARRVDWALTPLEHGTRDPLDLEVEFELELENLPELDFAIDEFDLELPAEAMAGGEPFTLEAELEGIFPILSEEDGPTDDGFCGEVSGQITSNKEVLEGTTFAAARLEGGSDIPAQTETSCDTLVDPTVP